MTNFVKVEYSIVSIICTTCIFVAGAPRSNAKDGLFSTIMMNKYNSLSGVCEDMLPTKEEFENKGLWSYDCARNGTDGPVYKMCMHIKDWKICEIGNLNRGTFLLHMASEEVTASHCKWFQEVGMSSAKECVETCSQDNATLNLCLFFSSLDSQLRGLFTASVEKDYTKMHVYFHKVVSLFPSLDSIVHKTIPGWTDPILQPCVTKSLNASKACQVLAKVLVTMVKNYTDFSDIEAILKGNLTEACASLNGSRSKTLNISMSANCSECQEQKAQGVCKVAAIGIKELDKKDNERPNNITSKGDTDKSGTRTEPGEETTPQETSTRTNESAVGTSGVDPQLLHMKEGISNLTIYILVFLVICIVGVILLYNKEKIIALFLGDSNGNKGRPSTMQYRKIKTEDVDAAPEKLD